MSHDHERLGTSRFILSGRSGSDSRFSIRESRFEPHQRCQFPSARNLSTMLQSTKVSVNWDLVEVALFGQKKKYSPRVLINIYYPCCNLCSAFGNPRKVYFLIRRVFVPKTILDSLKGESIG